MQLRTQPDDAFGELKLLIEFVEKVDLFFSSRGVAK